MRVKVYQYAKCQTCRNALRWLDNHGVSYDAVDIVASPPTKSELERALQSGVPLKKLFNTSGLSYREGGWGQRLAEVTRDQALEALMADGKLVKRPLVLSPDHVLVGFDERLYASSFAKAP